jgi:RNA polymerase sigma-70 factor (ECF subfamily)
MMRQLSARDQEFVELYFQEALPPEEVSRRMGISIATVYSKKAKIQARLSRSSELE